MLSQSKTQNTKNILVYKPLLNISSLLSSFCAASYLFSIQEQCSSTLESQYETSAMCNKTARTSQYIILYTENQYKIIFRISRYELRDHHQILLLILKRINKLLFPHKSSENQRFFNGFCKTKFN